ncbi:MAG: transposase [Gaiellaceae bacterium]
MQRRKGLRLRAFDYANDGPYHVTVCARERLFGDVIADVVRLSPAGHIVRAQIEALPQRLEVEVDMFVVMPNHVHIIVGLSPRARQASPLRLGTIIGSFKSGGSRNAGSRIWQRGYYDHVIRDENDLARVRAYIATNPIRWAFDPENPQRVS